jgi:hypothetical protein
MRFVNTPKNISLEEAFGGTFFLSTVGGILIVSALFFLDMVYMKSAFAIAGALESNADIAILSGMLSIFFTFG